MNDVQTSVVTAPGSGDYCDCCSCRHRHWESERVWRVLEGDMRDRKRVCPNCGGSQYNLRTPPQ